MIVLEILPAGSFGDVIPLSVAVLTFTIHVAGGEAFQEQDRQVSVEASDQGRKQAGDSKVTSSRTEEGGHTWIWRTRPPSKADTENKAASGG